MSTEEKDREEVRMRDLAGLSLKTSGSGFGGKKDEQRNEADARQKAGEAERSL